MKRALSFCVLLSACSPEVETARTKAPPDDAQVAASHLDLALMHDYELIKEQRQRWKNTPLLPALPHMADDSVFILPVMIDAVDARLARIPEKFRSLHVTTALGGDTPADFVRYLKNLLLESSS